MSSKQMSAISLCFSLMTLCISPENILFVFFYFFVLLHLFLVTVFGP
jgi:hypothetical protein